MMMAIFILVKESSSQVTLQVVSNKNKPIINQQSINPRVNSIYFNYEPAEFNHFTPQNKVYYQALKKVSSIINLFQKDQVKTVSSHLLMTDYYTVLHNNSKLIPEISFD